MVDLQRSKRAAAVPQTTGVSKREAAFAAFGGRQDGSFPGPGETGLMLMHPLPLLHYYLLSLILCNVIIEIAAVYYVDMLKCM
ncbi:hypothetical protein NDU88_004024 [Pleurodeles waltl]|uniref:Uncharacterized protein n=1 Tax=Pleurodeles waltl TaxID=8319 RepID=A0AAV7T6N3_PLEWA|nr:hypothetical protein NDU88_004024 [Pleurodeles waltl]